MLYRDLQAVGLPIGSGVVESGTKQAKLRLDGAGMRWSRDVLDNCSPFPFRAAVMSNTFDLLWPFVCRFQKSAPMLNRDSPKC